MNSSEQLEYGYYACDKFCTVGPPLGVRWVDNAYWWSGSDESTCHWVLGCPAPWVGVWSTHDSSSLVMAHHHAKFCSWLQWLEHRHHGYEKF